MKKLIGTLLACLAFCGTVQASIIDHGPYLTDTQSGLDWLDVTTTAGMSVTGVRTQLMTGGQFSGWRYATSKEFNQLVTNYTGITVSGNDYINQEPNKIDGLVTLLGSTADVYALANYGKTYDALLGYSEGEGVDYTSGYLGDLKDPTTAWIAMLWDYDADPANFDYSKAFYSDYYVGFSSLTYGSYLVRESSPIPEPSTILLILTAALVLIGKTSHRQIINCDQILQKSNRNARRNNQ